MNFLGRGLGIVHKTGHIAHIKCCKRGGQPFHVVKLGSEIMLVGDTGPVPPLGQTDPILFLQMFVAYTLPRLVVADPPPHPETVVRAEKRSTRPPGVRTHNVLVHVPPVAELLSALVADPPHPLHLDPEGPVADDARGGEAQARLPLLDAGGETAGVDGAELFHVVDTQGRLVQRIGAQAVREAFVDGAEVEICVRAAEGGAVGGGQILVFGRYEGERRGGGLRPVVLRVPSGGLLPLREVPQGAHGLPREVFGAPVDFTEGAVQGRGVDSVLPRVHIGQRTAAEEAPIFLRHLARHGIDAGLVDEGAAPPAAPAVHEAGHRQVDVVPPAVHHEGQGEGRDGPIGLGRGEGRHDGVHGVGLEEAALPVVADARGGRKRNVAAWHVFDPLEIGRGGQVVRRDP
mmetsp:Transcript_17291/g.34396  ORF Transcript_17291/g.34396 Transcript_17291/m.34396 type:complete len:402 (-) Transcript_17291:1802-3007(-)